MRGEERSECEKMNKKILLGMITIGLVAMLSGAGLYAFFVDMETSAGNTFTAGIIDLEVDCIGDTIFSMQDEPLPVIFDYLPVNNIMPGDSGKVTVSLHLKEGTNDAILSIAVRPGSLMNFGGANPEPEQVAEATGVDDAISDVILMKLWVDDGNNVYEAGEDILYEGPLTDMIGDENFFPPFYLIEMDAVACETYYVGISWELPLVPLSTMLTSNVYQGDYCTFDLWFAARQRANFSK